MKKEKIILLALAVLFGGFIYASAAKATGLPVVSLLASATSAPADNSTTITFTIKETGTFYNGALGWNCDPYGPESTGSGNSFFVDGAPLTSTNNYPTATYSGDSSGNGTCTSTFTMKSSVAEAKTVSLYAAGKGCPCSLSTPTVRVTFTTPAPAPTTTVPKTTTTTTKTTTATPVAPQPPATPQLATIVSGGTKLDSGKSIQLDQGKPLVLSGKTVPNGIVTLTIHSTPRTVTTTADKKGNWSYTVTGLAPGNHTVQANVKDPATGKTSPTAQILAFSIKKSIPETVATTTAAVKVAKKSSKLPLLVGIIVIVLAAGGGWYGWKWWNKKKTGGTPTLPAEQI